MQFLILALGIAGLWFGTELTIRGAVSVAKRLGLSPFIVGAAILSVGSDLPELAIAVDAALRTALDGDASDIVVGSAIGSTIGQIGLVLGVAALLAYLTIPKVVIFRHGVVMLGSIILLALLAADGRVTQLEGFALVIVYLIYFFALWTDVGKHGGGEETKSEPVGLAWLFLAIGFIIVIVGAELTVSSAIAIARQFEISETLVALLLVGMGTSLPELSISVGAALKKQGRMSVGNLIGSNIFDTLVPIGVAAAISAVTFDRSILTFELPYLFLLSLMVLFFFARKRGLQKWEAGVILAVYWAYVIYKVHGVG